MANLESLLELTGEVSRIAQEKIDRIIGITRRSRMLALNASIEAQRAGEAGKGFAVVAGEVKGISGEISDLTSSLQTELQGRLAELSDAGRMMMHRLDQVRTERLVDLAYNAIEIIDRNLYERSCDVRWWATDSALVAAAQEPGSEACAYASHRLGVILDSYTVYLDLWVADAEGRVLANGRPDLYPVQGHNVAGEAWFRDGLATRSGNDYAVADICAIPALGGKPVATYSTAIREGGNANGRPLGVLGIFFDWEPQARTVVDGIRLSPEEKATSRCLLLDHNKRIIADSHGSSLGQPFLLRTEGKATGCYQEADLLVGYAETPGYETYRGLGWYGVILQKAADVATLKVA